MTHKKSSLKTKKRGSATEVCFQISLSPFWLQKGLGCAKGGSQKAGLVLNSYARAEVPPLYFQRPPLGGKPYRISTLDQTWGTFNSRFWKSRKGPAFIMMPVSEWMCFQHQIRAANSSTPARNLFSDSYSTAIQVCNIIT